MFESELVLDPAAGTLTFLAEASKLAVEEFASRYGKGGKEREIKEFDESKYLGPGWVSISEESHLAGIVKRKRPILVILGNPPYSGHSSDVGEWISREIKVYYQVDGDPLGEKNPKWLQDDYVKFIRFAQWKIDQTGE